MGTNTGIGIGIGIPFRNNALGGDNIYFPPELKARMIGVWDNYGKKNTDADRNIIKNKIPNAGGDLEILNSAYKLNSGFGEYREDFTSWIVSKEPMTVEKTDSQVHISYIGTSYKELPMFEYSGPINENYSLTVYRTYDNYDRDEHRGYDERHRFDEHRGYDDDERMLLMQMLGVGENECYNDYGDEHFNKQEAKRTVDEMYHVKDGKKYIGEKYDMQKAHEVCNRFKDKLEEEVEAADVYVAINAQYHDYCELFEKWFGKGNFDEMVFESAIAFWFDDVDFGEDKLWKYFNELK